MTPPAARPDSERPPVRLVPAPRSDGAARWIARLNAPEAATYDAAVAPLAPLVERALGKEVLATRAAGRGAFATTRLEPWRPAWARWHRMLARSLDARPGCAVFVADVTRCYASIQPAIVADRLRALGVDPVDVARLRGFLERTGGYGVRGLPVGPTPSAILANAILSVVDDRLREAGTSHTRWVDDVVAVTGSTREAVRALDAFRRGLDRVGLEAHPSKTEILTDPDRIRDRLFRAGPSTGPPFRMR